MFDVASVSFINVCVCVCVCVCPQKQLLRFPPKNSSAPSADLQTGAKSVVALRAVNGIRIVDLAKKSTLGARALSRAKVSMRRVID